MSFEHGIQFAIQRGQASRYKEYPTLVALSSTTMSDGGSRNSDVTVLMSVLQVLVLALTLVTMAGETNGEEVYGAHCWRQEAAGADRTAPAGREFDSVSPCVVSRHAAPSIFLPGLSSPLISFLPHASPHHTGLALSSLLVAVSCLSFCAPSIPSSSLALDLSLPRKCFKHRRLDFESTTRGGS